MKILLLGHRGYLGSYLYENLNVDILSERKIFNNGKIYDYVINCIGKPDLEYCELNKEETDYSNYGVLNEIIDYYPKSKIINFSSYYVYDDDGFCTEESKICLNYNYCIQKIKSENLIKKGVSFRVGKLFGNPDLNKQNKLTEYIIKNDEINLDEIKFNPTSLKQILRVVDYEIKNNKLNGIFNMSNDGHSNHYEYGIYINELLGHTKKITKVNNVGKTFENYGKFLMSCEKLKKYVKLSHWKKDLKDYLNSLFS